MPTSPPLSSRLWVLGLLFLAASCSPVRHLNDNEALLDRVYVKVLDDTCLQPQDERIVSKELLRYLRQRPNARVMGMRFQLGIYNMVKPENESKMANWIRRIGEAPVIYSDTHTTQSVENLTAYLWSRGYYSCRVTDSVVGPRKRRVKVHYRVHMGCPLRVDSVEREAADSLVGSYAHRGESLIQPGIRLDSKILDAEAARIAAQLKEEGYYRFAATDVAYLADTNGMAGKVRVVIQVPGPRTDTLREVDRRLRRYRIDSISIYPAYDPTEYRNIKDDTLRRVTKGDVSMLWKGKPDLRPRALTRRLHFAKDSIVRTSLIDGTSASLSALPLAQLVNISLRRERNVPDSNGFSSMHARLYLMRRPTHAVQGEIYLTTSGSIGVEGNVSYTHRNIFRGGESLSLRLSGLMEALRARTNSRYGYAREIGVGVTLLFPYFVLPAIPARWELQARPTTTLQLQYSHQRRPDYTRMVASAGWSYSWRWGRWFQHTLTPADVALVRMGEMSEEFRARIASTRLAYAYTTQLITSTGYTLRYRYAPAEVGNLVDVRFSTELSGNILHAIVSRYGTADSAGVFNLWGVPYSNYWRGELSTSYTYRYENGIQLAVRLLGGIGIPYGNSLALPFEKMFFAGGANSLRGWLARALGPGSASEQRLIFPNQTGDLRLEANFEFRFPLVWKIEGATFIDAGNIWRLRSENPLEVFTPSWMTQIALSYGVGIRLNLGIFIFRVDAGIRLRDPEIVPDAGVTGPHWLPFQRSITSNDYAIQLGVGYPF